MEISVIEDFNKFKQLELQWKNIENNYGVLPFFDFDTLILYWERLSNIQNKRFGLSRSIRILVFNINEKIIGFLPLVLVKQESRFLKSVVLLEFLNQRFGGILMNMVGRTLTNVEINEVLNFIEVKFQFDSFNLSYLPKDSIFLSINIKYNVLHSVCMEVPISMDYKKIRSEIYSKNLRHVINKFNKRIKNHSSVIVGKVITDKNEILRYKTEIRDVSISKLHNSEMHSIYSDPRLGDYYFDSFINKEDIFLSLFEVDKTLLAYNYGFIQNNTVYALDASYNRKFSDANKIGFGILAYDQIIKFFAGKFNLLNMGHGMDNYKLRFTKSYVLTYSFIKPSNQKLKSRLLYCYTLYRKRKKEKRTLAYLHENS